MGSEKYRAGVLAGCALSRTPGDWPVAVAGLGLMRGGQPLARCIACPTTEHPSRASTNVFYGAHPLCKPCARVLASAGEEGLPFVSQALKRALSGSGESRGVDRGMPAANEGPSRSLGGAHNPTLATAPSSSGASGETR